MHATKINRRETEASLQQCDDTTILEYDVIQQDSSMQKKSTLAYRLTVDHIMLSSHDRCTFTNEPVINR